MKPNIFNIATKELHQDAFIVWFLQWADHKNKQYDPLLHACGQDFVRQLISKQSDDVISEITCVKAGRQRGNIDVWAEVVTIENNYYIIIEDKTFTTEHSEQLIRYRDIGKKYADEKGFKLICIYLKTGSEPLAVLKNIEKKHFAIFDRTQLKDLLNLHSEIKNDIFVDFKDRLNKLDLQYRNFETLLIGKWDDFSRVGFYQYLEEQIENVNWSYVNPPDGKGFWCAYFISDENRWNGYSVYLQIEMNDICFKINTGKLESRGLLRDTWSKLILEKAERLGLLEIRKPRRFGNGHYMTAAVIAKETWLGPDDSIIDKEEVVNKLKKYLNFLELHLKTEILLM